MRVLEASSLIVVVTLFASSCLCIVLPSQPRLQSNSPDERQRDPRERGIPRLGQARGRDPPSPLETEDEAPRREEVHEGKTRL